MMHRAHGRTFIFSYVLERKGEARVFALDNAHFTECALANDSQQPEVVEVYCCVLVRDALLFSMHPSMHLSCDGTHLGR